MFSQSVVGRILLGTLFLIACAPSEPTTTTAPAAPTVVTVSHCPFITNEEASEAMGQATTAHPGDETNTNCFLQPVSGQGMNVTIQILKDTANFYQLTTQPDASMFDVGDRAVWMSTTREFHVVDGNRTIVIKMSNEPMKTSDLTARARAIAQAVLAHR